MEEIKLAASASLISIIGRIKDLNKINLDKYTQ